MSGNEHGKTIDLAGVAAFASLVELLAQELGVPAGRMQGQLPNGPETFNQLHGEIDLNSQGFERKLTLICKPGAPLNMRFATTWGADRSLAGGVTADFYLTASVEQIIPQGRALARYVEDIFSVQDRMVTLGHGAKLAAMNVSTSQIEAFEREQGGQLVSSHQPKGQDNV
ncbi:MAG: hypothetical protein JSS86_08250 [Cyanobacteria bacterium SZAS LIN-2]|nr:hypothetical protein [Cyanobacteria bacterium SZAS LIN-3]MBS1996285.1 hypothetical protein [Cyanobacteria bacterium SZAS LIN-2]MBS2008659.1 hypothetical protein [Cyanobacteria bacterium SZAS TMP-1]